MNEKQKTALARLSISAFIVFLSFTMLAVLTGGVYAVFVDLSRYDLEGDQYVILGIFLTPIWIFAYTFLVKFRINFWYSVDQARIIYNERSSKV